MLNGGSLAIALHSCGERSKMYKNYKITQKAMRCENKLKTMALESCVAGQIGWDEQGALEGDFDDVAIN